jgi:cell division septation protein DedD
MRRVGAAGLGYGQTFLLMVAFLVASGLIFLFGLWVGRDLAERRLAQEERVVRSAVPAQPTPSEQTGVDVGFYEGLKATAYQRLQATAAATTPTMAHPAAPAAITPVPSTVPGGIKTPAKPISTTVPNTPKIAIKPTPTMHAKPAETASRAEEWADAGWTVQVNATTSQQQASDLAKSLKAKGYDAYMLPVPMQGQMWYRVRVGRFTTKDQAKTMEQRLKSDGMDSAYVVPR